MRNGASALRVGVSRPQSSTASTSWPWTPRTWPPSPPRGRDGFVAWTERGIDVAEIEESRRRYWLGPLLNNLGWEHFEAGEYTRRATRIRASPHRARARSCKPIGDRDRALRGRQDAPCARPIERSRTAPRAVGRVGRERGCSRRLVPRGARGGYADLRRDSRSSGPGAEGSRTAARSRSDVRKRRRTGDTPSSARQLTYKGMLPCFRCGFGSRFVSAVSSAEISTGRVRRGSITSST